MVLTAKSAGMEFHKIAGGPGKLDKESIRLSVSDMVAYVVDSDRYATRIDEDTCLQLSVPDVMACVADGISTLSTSRHGRTNEASCITRRHVCVHHMRTDRLCTLTRVQCHALKYSYAHMLMHAHKQGISSGQFY